MRLLVDSDLFCKLAASGLLVEAVEAVGFRVQDCNRLPALPHMLRKGRMRKRFDGFDPDAIARQADGIGHLTDTSIAWLDDFVAVQEVDPGEAQLFAVAAEHGFMVATGDKRALKGLSVLPGPAAALSGRIVVLEAVLLRLCDVLGPESVITRVEPLRRLDLVARTCFSPGAGDPRLALRSYYNNLSSEVAPLVLWTP